MTDARERIAAEVFKSNSATLIYDCEGKLTDYAKPAFVADRIIEIVQKAMTADATIEAFYNAEVAYEYDQHDGPRQAYQSGMINAFNTAFGADDDGGES